MLHFYVNARMCVARFFPHNIAWRYTTNCVKSNRVLGLRMNLHHSGYRPLNLT